MKFSMALLTFVSAVATALPSTFNPASANDGRGATIWKGQNGQGEFTSIPANNWCTDLNNIFGNFNKNVRSVAVEKGYKCSLIVDSWCPDSSAKFELGSKDQPMAIGVLPDWLDHHVQSVYCWKL